MTDLDKTDREHSISRKLLNIVLRQRQAKTLPRAPDGMRIYAIGDIHGRADLLDEMQEKMIVDARSAGSRKIVQIFLGDYVDRGADSKGVINWLLTPPPKDWARVCLKGNHEAMVLDFFKNPNMVENWRRYGGLETLHSYGVDIINLQSKDAPHVMQEEFKENFPDIHYDFFSILPLTAGFGSYFFVHAGVRPGVSLKKQKEEDLLWIRDEFLVSQMDFGKVIVHGHTPVEQPEMLSNRINIDTGAYITGNLTCLVLEGEEQRLL